MRFRLRIPTGFWFAAAAIAPLLGCTPRYAPYPAETPSVAAMRAQPADRVLDCRNPQDAPLCAELDRSAGPPKGQAAHLVQGSAASIKSQSAAACGSHDEESLDNCYVRSLNGFVGHPQDLMRIDVRDAVAYCALAGMSNDAQFCATLNAQHHEMFNQLAQERFDASARTKQALQRERERARADWESRSHWATTKGSGPLISGAIVCPDFQTVQYVFRALTAHWSDASQDQITEGQSRLLRQPRPEPNLELYDCVLIPPGTRVQVEARSIVPIVSAEVNGKTVKGVTMAPMLKLDEEPPAIPRSGP
jgi:hypothetical protein